MTNSLKIFLSIVLLILFSCSSNIHQIKISKNSYLVDVRTPEEFESGSVEGAVNIPVGELEQRISELEDKKNIVVFCRSGARASSAKQILESAGFTDVVNGGSWQEVEAEIK
ncbi:MAG: rhodanese-like domain-containing protein [Bacteroidota bacterium]|jgi:phage shock protein E